MSVLLYTRDAYGKDPRYEVKDIKEVLRNTVEVAENDALNDMIFDMKDIPGFMKAHPPQFTKHGTPFRWGNRDYRNKGLYFYDAIKNEYIPPYTKIDDEGSVPPRFRVEDGGFDPDAWVRVYASSGKSGVVEHNSLITLGDSLVDTIRDKLAKTAGDKVDVTINGRVYHVEVEKRDSVGNVAIVVQNDQGMWDTIRVLDEPSINDNGNRIAGGRRSTRRRSTRRRSTRRRSTRRRRSMRR
jgi:hypothetical protein